MIFRSPRHRSAQLASHWQARGLRAIDKFDRQNSSSSPIATLAEVTYRAASTSMSPYYMRMRERIGDSLLLVPSVAAVIHDEIGRLLLQGKSGRFMEPPRRGDRTGRITRASTTPARFSKRPVARSGRRASWVHSVAKSFASPTQTDTRSSTPCYSTTASRRRLSQTPSMTRPASCDSSLPMSFQDCASLPWSALVPRLIGGSLFGCWVR